MKNKEQQRDRNERQVSGWMLLPTYLLIVYRNSYMKNKKTRAVPKGHSWGLSDSQFSIYDLLSYWHMLLAISLHKLGLK